MQESSCDPSTVGGAGEQGLMQITKDKCGGAPNGNWSVSFQHTTTSFTNMHVSKQQRPRESRAPINMSRALIPF